MAGCLLVAGCSSTVGGGGDAAGVDVTADVTADAGVDAPRDALPPPGCDCPTGRCPVGQSWRAPDGCNTCTCMVDGRVACTLIGCIPPDAGPTVRSCGRNADCGPSEVCEYERGCATTRGRCVSNGCLSLPVAPQYCGCDGATLQEGSACLPDRPWRAMGPCPTEGDAGVGRYGDAVLAWASPGGFAGWGPGVRVHGDGLVEVWSMAREVALDGAATPPDRVERVSAAEAHALFAAWAGTSLGALPHPSAGQDCYPTVSVRLCESCAVQSIRYNRPADLLPEMGAVWGWFDRVLPTASPRAYCAR